MNTVTKTHCPYYTGILKEEAQIPNVIKMFTASLVEKGLITAYLDR